MDYHVLTQDKWKKSIQVVFHVPVPATGVNSVGVQWQAAIVKELGGVDNINSVLPDITETELNQLKAGALIERSATVYFQTVNMTNAQRVAQIEAYFNMIKTELIAEKAITLDFIGYSANVGV